ncbi:unnamed protein product [Rhizophagus irregularis]|nr:unnamed protein product [Rhizophagus irregularis]
MPTPTPATTGKRKLDLDDVNEDQDRKKSKLTVPEKILTSSQKIMEDIKKLPDDPNSSSTNNTSALHLSIKQANKKKIELYGGFDEDEMTQWWKKHVDLPLMNQQQREETEYITG